MCLPEFELGFSLLLADSGFPYLTVVPPQISWAPDSDYCLLGRAGMIMKARPPVHRVHKLMSTELLPSAAKGGSLAGTTQDSYRRLEVKGRC